MSVRADARSAEQPDESFLLVSAGIGVIGCLLAGVTPFAGGASAAFTATAGTQFAGLLLAAFGLYLTLARIAPSR